MNITKETKSYLLCRCHDDGFAAGPVLFKTEMPSFCFNQGSFTPNNLLTGVRQYGHHVCFKKDPLSHFKGLQIGIFVFLTERGWSQECCPDSDTKGVILFLLCCTFLVLKYFYIFLLQHFTVSVKPFMTSSPSSFA